MIGCEFGCQVVGDGRDAIYFRALFGCNLSIRVADLDSLIELRRKRAVVTHAEIKPAAK